MAWQLTSVGAHAARHVSWAAMSVVTVAMSVTVLWEVIVVSASTMLERARRKNDFIFEGCLLEILG